MFFWRRGGPSSGISTSGFVFFMLLLLFFVGFICPVAEVLLLLRMEPKLDTFKLMDFLVLSGHGSHPVPTSLQVFSFILWQSVTFSLWRAVLSVYSKCCGNQWVFDNNRTNECLKKIVISFLPPASHWTASDRKKSCYRYVALKSTFIASHHWIKHKRGMIIFHASCLNSFQIFGASLLRNLFGNWLVG